MKLLFENWRKYIKEGMDPDSDADDAAELRNIAKDIEQKGRYRVGDEGSRAGQKPLGPNYYLGRYDTSTGVSTLKIDFRNLKKPGENISGGVDPNKISELIEQAFYDNNANYFLHHPFVKVDNRGGGGYIDPSRSKYKVFLKFDDEEQYEDFKTEELDLIMQQINQAAADYEMNLRQVPLLQH
jgi:hypothetical protein